MFFYTWETAGNRIVHVPAASSLEMLSRCRGALFSETTTSKFFSAIDTYEGRKKCRQALYLCNENTFFVDLQLFDTYGSQLSDPRLNEKEISYPGQILPGPRWTGLPESSP